MRTIFSLIFKFGACWGMFRMEDPVWSMIGIFLFIGIVLGEGVDALEKGVKIKQ